jgi:hypothetical protein
MVEISDHIYVNDYKQFCDFEFNGKNYDEIPRSGTIYCPTDHIRDFFIFIAAKPDSAGPYVVVSAASDYCLTIQEEYPVSIDLAATIQRLYLRKITDVKDRYVHFEIDSPHRPGQCSIKDKYSLRCYYFTHATFNAVPKCIVKWFCVNSMIDHPKIEQIPLGIFNKLRSPKNLRKKDRVYCNFDVNIPERDHMMGQLKKMDRKFVFVQQKVPLETYYDQMESSKYVLCPPGNAFDTYRIYESIYLGCIPLVWESRMHRKFDYPKIHIKKLSDLTSANLSCWRGKIEEAASYME